MLPYMYTTRTHYTHSVEPIYPVQNPMAMQDRHVAILMEQAMEIEKAIFETATNREEYSQLIIEKIYRMREKERRRPLKSQIRGRIYSVMELALYSFPTSGLCLNGSTFGHQQYASNRDRGAKCLSWALSAVYASPLPPPPKKTNQRGVYP